VTGFLDQRSGFRIRETIVIEVAANAASQILGLSDVNYSVVSVFVEVHARAGRQLGGPFAELRDGVYTLIVSRGRSFLGALLLAWSLSAIGLAQQRPVEPEEPPEEDESLAPKEYSLNPVQAKKEITAGNFYMKKGNFRAAEKRYREASRWDSGSSEAFYKLGEASEKAKDFASAREAYTKYLALEKNAHDADALRKRMEKWPDADAPGNSRPQAEPTKPLDQVPSPDPIAPRAPQNRATQRRR
jgi:tetratricopeptide (TPR) repeat protein